MFYCAHSNLTPYTTGGRRFSAGNVWDDIKETLVCTTCWRSFDDLQAVLDDLRRQVNDLLQREDDNRLTHVQFLDPETLRVDGKLTPLRGPETDQECADAWADLTP